MVPDQEAISKLPSLAGRGWGRVENPEVSAPHPPSPQREEGFWDGLKESSPPAGDGLKESSPAARRRVLCLDLPLLPIERVYAHENLPKGPRPLVLTRSERTTVVVHACRSAQQHGVKPGMTLAQARALAPELQSREHHADRDRAWLRDVALWSLRFSPIVEPRGPDTLLLDVTGVERLFGSEANLAHRAVEGLQAQGLTVRAAIADTPGAACALASAADDASAGGDFVSIAPCGHTSSSLARLPPSVLRIDPDVDRRLFEVGVRSVGDLLMLPRSSLPSRFGSHLVLRIQQVLGEVYEPLVPCLLDDPPQAQAVFEHPLGDWDVVRSCCALLVQEICGQLVTRGLALRQLDCVLVREGRPPEVLTVRLSRASRCAGHLQSLLAARLEGLGRPSPSGRRAAARTARMGDERITGLRLIALQITPWQGSQGDLFEPVDPGVAEDLAALIDRLTGRLGPDAVTRPALVDDYQPEKAYRYQSSIGAVANPDAQKSRASSPPAPRVPSLPRPTRLLARPVPVRVLALAPQGPPTWIGGDGWQQRVRRACGPERVETGWWRGADVRRDYYRTTLEGGEVCWVYHDAVQQAWFLHGWFA
jgi:protein ImuB